MRDWTRDELITEIVRHCDANSIPRRLGVGCAISESNIRQYAERYGYHSNEGRGCAERGDLMGLQRVLDEMRSDGTPYDCSFGVGQNIVIGAPVGDKTMTPENVLLVRDWLFDPANAIPLMVGKLALFYHDDANPGQTEEDRTLYAEYRYNTGSYTMPSGQFAGNVTNYQRGLAAADAELENFFPPEDDVDKDAIRLQLDVLYRMADFQRSKKNQEAQRAAVIALKEQVGLS